MADPKSKIFTIAHLPHALELKWLQHLRDFDAANPDCHFEVAVEPPPDIPLTGMLKMLQIDPNLTFTKIFARARADAEFDRAAPDEGQKK